MIWNPLRDLIKRHADEGRPLQPAIVTDTSLWAATGPSWVMVLLRGASKMVIYRDGPEPAIGSTLQVIQMRSGSVSEWLALPLPDVVATTIPCTVGQFYTSAKNLSDSSWGILLCDMSITIADEPVWVYKSDHPSASGTRRPLRRAAPDDASLFRLFTWGTDDSLGVPGELFRSDDNGATWTSCGIAIVDMALEYIQGEMYAVAPDAVFRSTDFGVTWASRYGAPPDGSSWRHVSNGIGHTSVHLPCAHNPSTDKDLWINGFVSLVSDTGYWLTVNNFAHYFLPFRDAGHTASYNGTVITDPGSDPGSWHGPFTPPPNQWVLGTPRPNIYGPYGVGPTGDLAVVDGFNYRPAADRWYTFDYSSLLAAWAANPTYTAHAMGGGSAAYDDAGGDESFREDQGLVLQLLNDANGAFVRQFFGPSSGPSFYQQPGQHPEGLTPDGADWGVMAPGSCYVVALLDDVADNDTNPKFLAVVTTALLSAVVYTPIDMRHVADLGAPYRSSIDGVTTALPFQQGITGGRLLTP